MLAGLWLVLVSGVAVAADSEPPSVDLSAAAERAAGLPRLRSLLVEWRGELLLERYFHGARAERTTNIKSASKSVISALVGIAIERGLIESVDTRIASYFPDQLGNATDPRKREITVGDLLSMRSGLESTSSRNYGAWVQSGNWVRYALTRPMVADPGSRMIYSTGNTHLLSAVLTKASGRSTRAFAEEELAEPLGIHLADWPRDPQGIYFGGNDMVMTPRQMLAFGRMYLYRGRANGKQIVPEEWVDRSWLPRGRSRFSGQLYGYGWWMRPLGGERTFYAWGYGGQFVFVLPDLNLVIVATSSVAPGNARRSHQRELYDIVEHLIIEKIARTPVAETGPGPGRPGVKEARLALQPEQLAQMLLCRSRLPQN